MLLFILLSTLPHHTTLTNININSNNRQFKIPDEFYYQLHTRSRRENTDFRERRRTDESLKSIGNETTCVKGMEHENCTLTQNYTDANHRYYMSRYHPKGDWLFRDLSTNPPPDELKVEPHARLSTSYKKAFRIPIHFHFPFYGNFVDRIVVTTGGFINIGPQFHSFVHRVHYIAPLMADFNPASNNKSVVYIGKGDGVVIVQWNDFILNGQPTSQTFTFQVHLYQNGTIVLAYKNIPITPTKIRPPYGDVGVIAGFSDGFIITYKRHDKFRLIVHHLIYSYHKVNLPLERIKNGAAYKLTLLPNCIQFNTCTGCLKDSRRLTNFTCRWCPKLHQCSDMLDWHRQNWLAHCKKIAYRDPEKCKLDDEMTRKVSKLRKKRNDDEGEGSTAATVGIIVGMFLFIGLVVGVSLGAYAYTHPQSKAGIFLIENRRPWKRFNNNNSSEDDYTQLCTATST